MVVPSASESASSATTEVIITVEPSRPTKRQLNTKYFIIFMMELVVLRRPKNDGTDRVKGCENEGK